MGRGGGVCREGRGGGARDVAGAFGAEQDHLIDEKRAQFAVLLAADLDSLGDREGVGGGAVGGMSH